MSNPAFRQQAMTVLCMYTGYACFMVLKTAPIVAGPAILDDPSLGITKTQWGEILALSTFGGILGKFISGWMADVWGGKKTFVLGLMVTALALLAFARSTGQLVFGASFFLIVLAKSSGWPSMAKLIGHWFHPGHYGKVWGILSTSSRVGTIIATLLLGFLLQTLSWRNMLAVAGLIGVGVLLICLFKIKERPSPEIAAQIDESAADGEQAPASDSPHPLDGTTLRSALIYFFKHKRFWLITISLMGLTVSWDFLNFLPIYFKETLSISASEASMAASAFPIGSFFSVLAGGHFYDKLTRRQSAYLMGALLVVATLCLVSFLFLPKLDLSSGQALNVSIALLLIFGLCVAPCYYLPMSVFSIQFGGIHSGFLIAFLDALAFGASMVFSYFGGAIVDRAGGDWTPFLLLLISISVISCLATFFFLLAEARAHTKAQ